MAANYSLTRDPIFYGTVALFALLTTALPAVMGQPRFLPVGQALFLTAFVAMAVRKGHLRGALNVMALWLTLQFLVMVLLARFVGGAVERAIPGGFVYRGDLAAWFFSGGLLPRGLLIAPAAHLVELLGIMIGSLVSAGLIGAWFLVRAVDLAGFGMGTLLSTLETPVHYGLALPLWSLVRIAGYAGLVVLCAEPLLTGFWSPAYYWRQRRRLILTAGGLVLAGLLLELILPPLWSRG